jgi:hypothetical protein
VSEVLPHVYGYCEQRDVLKNEMSETNYLHHVPLHLRPTVTESQEHCHRTVSSGFSSEEFEAEIIRVDNIDKTVRMLN